jgi:branched-chain amino acid transport system permease protein
MPSGRGALHLPVVLLPLVGGLAGMGFAVLLGYVTTRKSGTTFSMITLGMAELVFAMSLMFCRVFGGEAGVSGNRVVGAGLCGHHVWPAATGVLPDRGLHLRFAWVLLYALTQTPLGRILNAVRDNPERVEFIGYNTQQVRYRAFIIAGFFAGIAGGLGAIEF